MRLTLFLIILMTISQPFPVHAYVGPGLGLGALGLILGVIASIILAIIGILWYPSKRIIRKLRKTKPKNID